MEAEDTIHDKPSSDDEDVESHSTVDAFSEDESEEHDTNAEQYQKGTDMQGIPWSNLHLSREDYRKSRLEQYPQYLNVLQTDSDEYRAIVAKRNSAPQVNNSFFEFVHNYRAVHSKIVHFQLRNLLWSTTKNDIYVVYENCVNHYNPFTRATTSILDLRGKPLGPRIPGISRVQVSTLCVKDNFVAAGGFGGELVCKRLDQPGLIFAGRIAQSDNGITNGLEIPTAARLSNTLVSSNNDCAVRFFDMSTFQVKACFSYPWAVNYSTVNPVKGEIIAVVGDDVDTYLSDTSSGTTIHRLKGHQDFSFAAAWHPDGHLLATGNQDTTTLVWDTRYLASPLASLYGSMGAIRSTRFDPTGRFLAVAEPADFVHIYDTKSGFQHKQTIDLFGEIAGISFTPDGDQLFVGVADATYSSLLCFERRHRDWLRTLSSGWSSVP